MKTKPDNSRVNKTGQLQKLPTSGYAHIDVARDPLGGRPKSSGRKIKATMKGKGGKP